MPPRDVVGEGREAPVRHVATNQSAQRRRSRAPSLCDVVDNNESCEMPYRVCKQSLCVSLPACVQHAQPCASTPPPMEAPQRYDRRRRTQG